MTCFSLNVVNYALILSKYYEEGSALLDLLLTHSEMVARKALTVAELAKLNIDRDFVYNAAMLHDIGIFRCNAAGIYCYGDEPYIRHGLIGGELLRKEGVDEAFARVCERHTGSGLTAKEIAETGMPLPHIDLLPETLEEKLICYADKFFSKSGDPREEKSLDRVRKSMAKFGADSLARFDALHAIFNSSINLTT
ncbi:MAG: HDIG domain-containing protein [Muribaculaceae bacterium]|nr:HDIG domain-containing protein [Muribaculaceae bacterium]